MPRHPAVLRIYKLQHSPFAAWIYRFRHARFARGAPSSVDSFRAGARRISLLSASSACQTPLIERKAAEAACSHGSIKSIRCLSAGEIKITRLPFKLDAGPAFGDLLIDGINRLIVSRTSDQLN